jgi:7,8-dihydropterin-6-yl-methyl-4-(beta-D-ribofuranosyl)aminobenzene 5'-phosphate synthase
MQVRLLCENLASDMEWQAEWGFCALIEFNGHTVLFDTGFSDVWQRNAAIGGLDLEEVEVVALSHFHRDHTRGLLSHTFQTQKRLVAHPRVLTAVLDTDDAKIIADYANIQDTMQRDFSFEASTSPKEIVPGGWFLGEIPRVTSFERGMFFDDPMHDDTALAFETEKGAVVISGCSHAGICNICEYAKRVTNQGLYAVIGGFHMMKAEDPPVDETISYFQHEAPEVLLPMHCIDFEYMVRFKNELNVERKGSGDLIEL